MYKLLFFYLLVPFFAECQSSNLSIGIDGGNNFTTLLSNSHYERSLFVGQSIGLKVRYNLKGNIFVPKAFIGGGKSLENLCIETGLRYVCNGYGYRIQGTQVFYGMDQLEWPLLLSTRFTQWLSPGMIKKRIQFIEWLGPVLVLQRNSSITHSYKLSDEILTENISHSSIGLSYVMGVGMERKIKGIGFHEKIVDMIIGTGFSYHLGFTNISTISFTGSKSGDLVDNSFMGSYFSMDLYVIPLQRLRLIGKPIE